MLNSKPIKLNVKQGITILNSDLEKGTKIEDLSWASNSSVACFPATQNNKFSGNHVLFYFELPSYSEVKITLIPANPSDNMSLYAYQVGQGQEVIPPKLHRCVTCEADYKSDYPMHSKEETFVRSVRLNSIINPYRVYIGVAGANGLTQGKFSLKLELKTREEQNSQQDPITLFKAPSEKGKTLTYKGDLKQGVKIHDLSWASNSSVACFPETQNNKFSGNHVLFTTDLPPYCDLYITLRPTDKNANMSLYAYQVGVNSIQLPPKLSQCVSCEADYKSDYPVRGKDINDNTRSVRLNSIRNPYKVIIGVAGTEGLTKGDFLLELRLEAKK